MMGKNNAELGVRDAGAAATTLRVPHSPLGLYIHIPFCHARCGYCDFVTFTSKDDQRSAYVGALCQEIKLYSENPPSPPLLKGGEGGLRISTVFFGGGTPSVLEPEHIKVLFRSIRRQFLIDPLAEITLEANPESITPDKLAAWQEVGINRLSIGLQAYDDDLLKSMGRLHTVRQFEEAYQKARDSGFSNINIDLIYGFTGQTLKTWQETVRSAAALQPEHLSLYALTVEEHTPF